MRIFLTTWFERFARQQRIEDSDLYGAISRTDERSIDADIGGGVLRQRIARRNEEGPAVSGPSSCFVAVTGRFSSIFSRKVTAAIFDRASWRSTEALRTKCSATTRPTLTRPLSSTN